MEKPPGLLCSLCNLETLKRDFIWIQCLMLLCLNSRLLFFFQLAKTLRFQHSILVIFSSPNVSHNVQLTFKDSDLCLSGRMRRQRLRKTGAEDELPFERDLKKKKLITSQCNRWKDFGFIAGASVGIGVRRLHYGNYNQCSWPRLPPETDKKISHASLEAQNEALWGSFSSTGEPFTSAEAVVVRPNH